MKIKNQAGRGFTLLEVLTVLAVIGFMVTVVSVFANRNFGDYRLQQAIKDMDKIKTAIRDGFYRDTGLIPQSASEMIREECGWEWVGYPYYEDQWICHGVSYMEDDYPEFATQYLCLKNDCEEEEIRDAIHSVEVGLNSDDLKTRTDYVRCDELGSDGNCQFGKLCRFFYFMTKPSNWSLYPADGPIKRAFLYNPIFKQGWNGPYLEGNTIAVDQDGDNVPLIAVPWASDIEQVARDEGDDALAEKYRKGKYYHIRVKLELNKELPPWMGKINTFSTGLQPSLIMPVKRNGILQDKTTARIICYGENGLDDGSYCKEYDEEGNCAEDQETTIEELRDLDFDIGDDLVMFIFGDGFTRVPLER